MGLKAAAVLALLAISCVNAKPYWNLLIPEGKEVIYKYEGLVKAGTHIPHEFASEFLLTGQLHIQLAADNELLVRLDHLQYELDNGRDSEDRHTTKHALDTTHIAKPFKILYEDSGIVKKIITEEKEPEYSLNMKKAIATTLQVNWEKVILDSVKPHAFASEEKSLFGLDTTLYSVRPKQNYLKVVRYHDRSSTEHFYKDLITDAKPLSCQAAYEEPITHDSQKMYIIERTNPGYVLKYIETNGGVYYQPYQAESTAYFIYVNQTFKFLEIADKKTPMAIETQHEYTTLTYIFVEHCTVFEHVPDPKMALPVIKTHLHEMVQYLKEDKILPVKPDIGKGQLVNRLVKTLSHLDVALLEQLYTELATKAEDKQEENVSIFVIYKQLLPLIGTKYSLKFIVKLLKEETIDKDMAIELLEDLPFYIKLPSIELITELEPLLHLTNWPQSVQKVGVTSFATLLYKLHDYNMRHEIKDDSFFIKYIELFINKVKTLEKMEDKYLYLDALYNMNNDLVIKYLEPLIKGEWFNDIRLRYKGMISLANVIVKSKHHLKMFELYWPVFTDRTLPSYVRIMAFYVMMKSQPSLSYQINIAAFMSREKDVDLLSYYYTYLNSYAKSENACIYRSTVQAKQLLLYWPINYKHSLTQFTKIDMMDWDFNFGQSNDFSFINTEEALMFMWKKDINVMGVAANPTTMYVKITGLNKKLLQDVEIMTQGSNFFNYDKLFDLYSNTDKDTLQIEFVSMRYGQIVESIFFGKSYFQNPMAVLQDILLSNTKADNGMNLDIHYDMFIKVHVPTDIGFIAIFELLMPSVEQTDVDFNKDESTKLLNINMDLKYQHGDYYSYGLMFYNPLASVWQGINRYINMETVVPLNLALSVNPQQNSFKFTWKRHKNSVEDVMGYRSHVSTVVFIKDYLNKGILQKTSPSAKNFVTVTHEDRYKHNYTLINGEEYNTGYKYQFIVFDDENPKYYEQFPQYSDFLIGPEPWTEKLMNFLMYRKNLQFAYDTVERGIMYRLEPSVNNPVSSVELTMRFSTELFDRELAVLQPGRKINTRATYVVKKDDHPVKTWDFVAGMEWNAKHTVNSLKLDITRTIPGQKDYKICVQYNEKYSEKDLTGNMVVSMSQSEDGKCNNDETVIRFTMKGEQLPEQTKEINNYESCHQLITPIIKDMRPFKCYAERFSLRSYTVDVKYVHVPTEFQNSFISYMKDLAIEHDDNYEHFDVVTPDIEENSFKIQLRYPISKHVVDMKFVTPKSIYAFRGLSADVFEDFGIYPDNLYYGNMMYVLHELGLTHMCVVNTTSSFTSDWKLVMGDKEEDTKYGIFAKLAGDQLVFKYVTSTHVVLITPNGETYTVTIDGKDISDQHYYYHELFGLTKMEDSNTWIIAGRYSGAQVMYNGREIFFEYPSTDMKLAGMCVQ